MDRPASEWVNPEHAVEYVRADIAAGERDRLSAEVERLRAIVLTGLELAAAARRVEDQLKAHGYDGESSGLSAAIANWEAAQ